MKKQTSESGEGGGGGRGVRVGAEQVHFEGH